MPVYVDEPTKYPPEMFEPDVRQREASWSHMWSDPFDADQLHAIAKKIGLRRSWFQVGRIPHYDVTTNKRRQAIAAGAVPRSLHDWIREEKRKDKEQ